MLEGGFRRGSVESKHSWGGPDAATCWVLPLIRLHHSHLSDQTGWFQAAASRGGMVVEASLFPNNCGISSDQSWAEFGDGWMASRQRAGMLQHPGYHVACAGETSRAFPKRGGWDGAKGMVGLFPQPARAEGAAWAAGDTHQRSPWPPGRAPTQGGLCSAMAITSARSAGAGPGAQHHCPGCSDSFFWGPSQNAAPGRAAGAAGGWVCQRHACQALVLKARPRRWLQGQVFQQDPSPPP